MTNNRDNPKSLVTQILEETLNNLKSHEEFNQTILDSLEDLAKTGKLKNPQLVRQSLETIVNKNENHRN